MTPPLKYNMTLKEYNRRRAILRALLQVYVDHTTRTLYLSRSAAARRRRAGAWRFVVVPPSRARRRTPTGDGPSRARRACDLTKKIYIYKYGSRERLPRRSAVSRSRHNWSAVAVTPCGRVDVGLKSLAFFLSQASVYRPLA